MINWGIIGCGDVSEVKSGPAFNKIKGSRLVAVMRRNAAKAADYAFRHGVSKWYDNASQLLGNSTVNAVYVATPPVFHEDYTIAALKAGKNVYVEKPVSISVESVKRMIDAAEKYNGKVCVAHYRRALPLFNEIKNTITRDVIGKVKMVKLKMMQPYRSKLIAETEDNWRLKPEVSGGGLFFDLAPHQLDILIWMLGDASNYSGIAVNQSGYYEAEDTVCGTMQLGGDIPFSGNWCFTMAEEINEDLCEVIGVEGVIRFPVFGAEYQVTSGGTARIFTLQHPPHIQQPMIEKVVKYFSGEGDNPCSLQEALKSMNVMESFLKVI